MQSINPANGKVLNEYREHTMDEVSVIISEAEMAQHAWKMKSMSVREEIIRNVAVQLLKNKDEAARTMALEMGKPLAQGVGEIEKCAWLCNHFATKAREYLKDIEVQTEAQKAM